MKATDKLRALAGSNIAESMGRGGAGGSAAPLLAPAAGDRYAGLNRVKAFAIPTDRISPDPDQPRKEFDEASIDRLAGSLKEKGQLQPVRVRWDAGAERWVIIAGERRWRAAVRAGLPTLAAVEAPGPLSDDEVLEEQLVENALREDLSPVDQARAFKALMDRRGWSAVRLGEALRIHNSTVDRALALLRLPADVQVRVESGEIAPSVAYEVSKLDGAEAQAELAARVVSEGLTRADVAGEVKRAAPRKGRAPRKPTSRAFRSGGYRVTVENARGVDVEGIAAALADVLARLEPGGRGAT